MVGKIVREAERHGESWATLPLSRLKTFSPLFEADLQAALTVDAALDSRDVPGGTAPARVREALADSRRRLASSLASLEDLP
jgi:argininosuccinate lyase